MPKVVLILEVGPPLRPEQVSTRFSLERLIEMVATLGLQAHFTEVGCDDVVVMPDESSPPPPSFDEWPFA